MFRMTQWCARLIAAAAVANGVWSAAYAETIAEVEKQATELNRDVRSLTADLRVVSELQGSDRTRTVTSVKVEQLLEGDVFLSNLSGKTETVLTSGGKESKSTQEIFEVNDGRFRWRQEPMKETFVVFKAPAGEPPAIGGRLFPELRKNYQLELAADERVGEDSCWTIIATPKTAPDEAQPFSVASAVYSVRKKDGIVARTQVFRPDDKQPFITNLYSNIKVNPKLDRSRFQYKPPEGIQVVDETEPAPADGG